MRGVAGVSCSGFSQSPRVSGSWAAVGNVTCKTACWGGSIALPGPPIASRALLKKLLFAMPQCGLASLLIIWFVAV